MVFITCSVILVIYIVAVIVCRRMDKYDRSRDYALYHNSNTECNVYKNLTYILLTAYFMPSMYASVTLNSVLCIEQTAVKSLHALSTQLLRNCTYCPTWNLSLTQLHHSNAVAVGFSINSLVFRTDCKNVQTLIRLVPYLYSSPNSLQFPREENPSQDKLSI